MFHGETNDRSQASFLPVFLLSPFPNRSLRRCLSVSLVRRAPAAPGRVIVLAGLLACASPLAATPPAETRGALKPEAFVRHIEHFNTMEDER